MAAPTGAPAPTAEPPQTTVVDFTTSSLTPPPAHRDGMGPDLSSTQHATAADLHAGDLPPLPADDDDSFLREDFHEGHHSDGSRLMDSEMERQLMDIESSFVPEPEPQAAARAKLGADDTFLFAGSPGTARTPPRVAADSAHTRSEDMTKAKKKHKKPKKLEVRSGSKPHAGDGHDADSSTLSDEPPTPAGAYKTPAAQRPDTDTDHAVDASASVFDAGLTSPSLEVVRRNQLRSASDTIPEEDIDGPDGTTGAEAAAPAHSSPRRPTSSASTVKAPDFTQLEDSSSLVSERELNLENITVPTPAIITTTPKAGQRPSYLQHRHSSQRSSVSSFTNRSDISGDIPNDSLGADYALQTGGAIPRSSGPTRGSMGLSRLPSLGSIASSMSGYSDPSSWDKGRSISADSLPGNHHPERSLGRLEEEVLNSNTPPETPRAPSAQPSATTDTAITRHVRDIQVPDTVAREFREKHSRSPDKRHVASSFTRSKHNLTLKEQNSKIDKLSKENFDLKLKIHFLDQALQNRSDEGVKEMISKNVQLQTDLATEKKESQSMRKKIRDLERNLKAQEEGLATTKSTASGSDDGKSDRSSRQAELEEEIIFLRERLDATETVVDQWQQEALQKEADNRRMADYIKTMQAKSSPAETAGLDEAVNIWKEDFEDERAQREQVETRCQQAEAECERLREEVQRLREQNQQLQQYSTMNHHPNRVFSSSRLSHQPYATRSNSESEGNDHTASLSIGGTSTRASTLVEQLQNDNEKLQRDLHAQASMLTSRSRENTRLREENEGLKLTIRRGDVGSIGGDSILERSISRNHMRSVSRASGGTRVTQVTQMSDPEREDYESKCAALRDELSQMKLSYKELDDQLNGHLDMLETTEAKVNELEKELEAQNEDLQALSNERNEALEMLQDKEQECEEMRQEALETVQRLENELERKQQEHDRILVDLENTTEDFNSLQQEMKNVSECLLQLEDDRDASSRKIQNLESEIDDANQELDRQDKLLTEERSKNEKLEIQLESCQGEIDFLREEQEGDKIKIGELESALNHAQITIQDEKERFRDLEDRMNEERQQRDVLESQEKEEVEKIINELNSQLTKLKDENRKLRKNLSSKEVEASTWKQQLEEFETNLRETLGNPEGSRAGLLKDIVKLQQDLDSTLQELDLTKNDLTEKDRILRNRDALLESTGMESRRLAELLERERQVRRQDQTALENAKRSQQSIARILQQHEGRVLELESLRSQDRQKFHNVEKQYKEQLLERNSLLFALWNRLSTLCGVDWCRNHALINDELTSMELISRNIQGFNKNIILAVKTVEGVIGGFKQRIRTMEKDLIRDYQTLEHSLEGRVKRLDQLEKLVTAQRQSIGRPSTIRGGLVELNSAELNKLRTENKTLRTEVQTLRSVTGATQSGNEVAISRSPSRANSRTNSPTPSKRSSMHTLLRAHSTSVVEHLTHPAAPSHPYPASVPLQPSEQKWIHRLKELERRLKAEREARLLDRSGARKRLEQKLEENADLRAMLERERERHGDDNTFSPPDMLQRSASVGGMRMGGEMSTMGSLRSRNQIERELEEEEEDEDLY